MTDSSRELVSLRTLAKRLGLSATWLRAETEARRIPHLQAGRRALYSVEAVRDALLQRAAGAEGGGGDA